MEQRKPDLDDPVYAAFAWGRFRRILGWMALVALAASGAALLCLYWWLGELRLHVWLPAAIGIFLTVMLTATLMGLMFLSSGSGHDERVEDPLKGEVDIGD